MKKIKNALLVDDDQAVNFINKRLFDSLGAAEKLSTARNGKEALTQIQQECGQPGDRENCPDFILLDIKMPVMDGFEFLQEYGKLGLSPAPVVYMLTTSLNPNDLEQARSYNIAGILEKPLTRECLQQLLEKHF